jgi:hemerythrin-like domain-containing protein
MVGVTIGGKPLAGFDQPIELLKDCHRRIEHFLDVLQKVVELFGEGHLSEEGRRALETSLDYFGHAAPRHTADEEQSLFPRMRRSSDAQVRALMAELDRLESDHRHVESCHAQVDELGRAWLKGGRIDELSRAKLRALVKELVAIYAAHIRLEEEGVFAAAAKILEPRDLGEVGVEMRRRRFGN